MDKDNEHIGITVSRGKALGEFNKKLVDVYRMFRLVCRMLNLAKQGLQFPFPGLRKLLTHGAPRTPPRGAIWSVHR